jgi:CRISPR-associated protein Cmr6
MKKGTLVIIKKGTSKFISEFHEEGTGKIMPLSFYHPQDEHLNGSMCGWDSKGGKHILTLLEDDEVIYPENKNKMEDSYKPNLSSLPDFVTKWLAHDTNNSVVDNFNLKLNKGARFDNAEPKFKFHSTENDPIKGKIPFSIKASFGNFNKSVIAAKGFSKRTEKIATNLGLHLDSFEVESSQGFPRLIIGLGNESVYENGMTLHHIYGIPYIPASAVKGITRSWIITEAFGTDEKDGKAESCAEEDSLFTYIFGKGGDGDEGGNKGNVFFFDAFPTTVPKIEPDIINNHYQSYYDGTTPPADWISPNPVFFLTVKECKFCFQVGVKRSVTCNDLKTEGILKEDENLRMYKLPEDRGTFKNETKILDIITGWLKDALEHHGIGAKTAVGYGRMKN